MKPITGQYECVHSSGVGLDYFTSRIDKLTLLPNGRFTLNVQKRSRAVNAAQSWLQGQQSSSATPETRLEGNYVQQDTLVVLTFDGGGEERAQLSWNGEGMQIGPNYFTKVSDSTLLPPTHRLKQDMDDIAKGLKIATTLGGFAVKAAKTLQGTMQSAHEDAPEPGLPQSPTNSPPPTPPSAAVPPTPAPPPAQSVPPAGRPQPRFCDQCGAPIRPGKRFCNNCGARLL